jgi:hypothetical protein
MPTPELRAFSLATKLRKIHNESSRRQKVGCVSGEMLEPMRSFLGKHLKTCLKSPRETVRKRFLHTLFQLGITHTSNLRWLNSMSCSPFPRRSTPLPAN